MREYLSWALTAGFISNLLIFKPVLDSPRFPCVTITEPNFINFWGLLTSWARSWFGIPLLAGLLSMTIFEVSMIAGYCNAGLILSSESTSLTSAWLVFSLSSTVKEAIFVIVTSNEDFLCLKELADWSIVYIGAALKAWLLFGIIIELLCSLELLLLLITSFESQLLTNFCSIWSS